MAAVVTEGVRKRTRLESDERRRQILDSARDLLSSRPYSEVSMADLAEAAGVARGLLHHYFGSKRDLYLAVVRDSIQLPSLPAGDAWEASVERWLAMIDDNRELWMAALRAGGVGADPEVESMLDEGKELIAEQALRAVGIAEPTPAMLAMTRGFGGFTEEVTREWLVRGRLTREQVRVLLAGGLPLLVRDLLPAALAVES